MKTSIRDVRFVFASIALLFLPSVAFPQAAPAATASAADSSKTTAIPSLSAAAKDEAIAMSPFVVATEKDVGFVATTSLAGGRMKTDLKDTPLAYSVFTKEFLEALDITNPEAALEWGVNSFQTRGDITDRLNNFDGGTRTRVRGVIVKTMRNFFESARINDIYCQDRIDFARGTNALLIGNAGLGGAQVMLTKQAMFDSRKGELAVSLSDQGVRRATFDYNLPVKGKLAVRANLLEEKSKTWRGVQEDQRKGIYLTGSYRPWRTTQLRVDYESFNSREILGLNGLNDAVSGWDGVTVVDAPTATITNNNALGVERLGSATAPYMLFLPGYNNSTVYNFANNWRTMGGGASSLTPVNGILPASTSSLGASGARITGVQNQWEGRFSIATSKSKFFVPDPSYAFGPDTPNFMVGRRVLSAFIDQEIGKHLFVNVGFNRTVATTVSNILASRFSTIYVDVNKTLPDGKANPYFLQPFVETTRDDQIKQKVKIDELRAALAYVQDNTRFGSFKVNALAGTYRSGGDTRTYTHVMARNPDIRQRPVNDSPGFRYYLLDGNRPYAFPNQFTYTDPIAGTTASYPVQELLNLSYTDSNNVTAWRYFDYVQTSGFAKLWKDRIILLAGRRWDVFKLHRLGALTTGRAAYPTDWDGQTLLYNPAAPGNYSQLTSTQKATYNPPDLKQRVASNTGGGIINFTKWLGAFYNYADTYDTSRAGVYSINWETVAPLIAHGWDVGIRLSPFNGRINVSFSKYRTVQNHTWSGVDRFEIPRLAEANALGDTSPTGRNTRGLGPVPSPYFDYQDLWALGKEFEVVANITPNWRLTLNYALPESYANNRYPETATYLAKNEKTLRQIVLDTGAVIDATTNLASNPGIATSVSPDINQAVSDWNWVVAFDASYGLNAPIVSSLPKYTSNIYTDYRFTKGPLKNLRIGGGVQFRGKLALGNRGTDTIVNPANPLTAIDDPSVDSNTFVYMPAWHMATGTLGYEMKVREKMRLSFNLSVSNLLNRRDLIFTGAGLRPKNGDIKSPAREMSLAGYFPDPRTFRFTTRLTF